ncbi:hypothetical protein GC176_23915 [bacterium]|nr:hypothetical protein [bacterium]
MSIMPLPLTPFEHFMLAGDCPENPMSFFLRIRIQGRIDRQHLDESLETALKLHPLLHARIHGYAGDATSHICWIDADMPIPVIDWNDVSVPVRFAGGRWIDLQSESGLRLWVRETGSITTLLMQVHHCCCDGLGASQFVQTLFTAYHLLRTSGSVSALVDRFDVRLLRERDLSCSSWSRVLMTARHAIPRVARFSKGRPMPLATLRDQPLDDFCDDMLPPFQTFTFDITETNQISTTARRLGVSLNDLLLRDLFLVLDEWNRCHTQDGRCQPIRICMPVNVRRSSDNRMPAANVISLSFVDQEPHDLADAVRLLASVHAQTSRTRRLRSFLAFVPALKLLGMFPGRLHARAQRTHCLSTAVLSNIGVLCAGSPLLGPDRRMTAGGLLLESVEAVLPLRPLTHVALVVSKYARKLTLTISHNPRWINAAESHELLNRFVRQLRRSASAAPGRCITELQPEPHSDESVSLALRYSESAIAN